MSIVAVIDSGIKHNSEIKNLNVIKSMKISINENYSIKETPISISTNNHGTVIAEIITLINPNVELIDINILDDKLQTNGSVMLHAINTALNFNPDIINLSLGTSNIKYIFGLNKLIKKAVEKKIIIVAAYSNDNKITFPAVMNNVVGVKRVSTLKVNNIEKSMYSYRNGVFFAPYDASTIYRHKCKQCNHSMEGNSISAAYVSGELSLIIDNNKHLAQKEILNKFIQCKTDKQHLWLF